MNFLCVSDQIDPLVYSVSAKERYGDVDAVFCAGDLSMEYVDYIVTTLGKPTYFVFGNHNLKEYSYYSRKQTMGITATPEKASASGDLMKYSHGAVYASNRVLRTRKLRFKKFRNSTKKQSPVLIAGISGSVRYNNGDAQFTNSQMTIQLLKLIPKLVLNRIIYGRYLDIFLTHSPPRHIHDKEDPCHKGFECFNWFIKRFRPALMIHGHIHLYDNIAPRETLRGSTLIVNCFSHLVIEMKEEFNDKGERIGFTVHSVKSR